MWKINAFFFHSKPYNFLENTKPSTWQLTSRKANAITYIAYKDHIFSNCFSGNVMGGNKKRKTISTHLHTHKACAYRYPWLASVTDDWEEKAFDSSPKKKDQFHFLGSHQQQVGLPSHVSMWQGKFFFATQHKRPTVPHHIA